MNKLFTPTHEWIEFKDDEIVMGISDHAQHLLGSIVFIELPKIGNFFKKNDEIAVVESPKAASAIYSPIDGTVSEVNEKLLNDPETINRDPYGDGWMIRFKKNNDFEEIKKEMLTEEEYLKTI